MRKEVVHFCKCSLSHDLLQKNIPLMKWYKDGTLFVLIVIQQRRHMEFAQNSFKKFLSWPSRGFLHFSILFLQSSLSALQGKLLNQNQPIKVWHICKASWWTWTLSFWDRNARFFNASLYILRHGFSFIHLSVSEWTLFLSCRLYVTKALFILLAYV